MTSRLACVALLLVAAGCGGTKLVDPCAGQKGTCLAIQIEGSSGVSRISGARVHVTGDALDYAQTVTLSGGGATALPVALAVLFPTAPPTTAIEVDIVGTNGGVDVGEGKTSATLTAGAHSKVDVTLGRLTGSDGGADANAADGGPADLTITGDLIGYAPLTVQLTGSGTGSISATGLACSGNTCSGVYPVHSTVTLGAVPATNATFGGWNGGGCVGTGSCVVTLDQPTTVTATFNWLFVPSHVSASAYKTNAGNLSGVTAIDTTALTINGAAPPTGVTFAIDNGIAVLSIGTWNITSTVTVTGNAPLAVIAAGSVVLSGNAALHADANLATPGPGGNAPCSATGAGHDATSSEAPGGGDYGGGAAGPPDAGAAGATYGALLTDFCGGSHGGAGTPPFGTGCTQVAGGAGGGAIQISSAVSILVESSTISAAGGGGTSDCYSSFSGTTAEAGQSSGGAGGEIFLEAPMVSVTDPSTLHTGLFANGGGAGGAHGLKGTGTGVVVVPGTNGSNGQSAQAAATGVGNGAYSPDGTQLTPATYVSGGGGGGGVGRIWLRTRGTPATISAELSPAPSVDTTL